MSDDHTPANDAPDPGHDPIDKAYVQAEAVLSDDAARAARRARLLAAVAQPPAPAPADASDNQRPRPRDGGRGAWRRGGWLAAACVAGLSLLVVTQTFQLPRRQVGGQTTALPPAVAKPDSMAMKPAAPPRFAPPAPAAAVSPPAVSSPQASVDVRAAASVARRDLPTAPSPAPIQMEPPRRAFPAAPAEPVYAPAPPPPPPPPMAAPAPPAQVVTAERAAPAPQKAAGYRAEGAVADAAQDRARSNSASSLAAPSQPDAGARLRTAAAAGRTAEVKALLDQGAPVDAPDADGDTALIKSIQANHPATAALLRHHGASLDQRNGQGVSARDLAAAKGDAALNKALGL